jgi:hypothetical protein
LAARLTLSLHLNSRKMLTYTKNNFICYGKKWKRKSSSFLAEHKTS